MITYISLILLGEWSILTFGNGSVWGLFLVEGRWPVVVGTDRLHRYDGISWTTKYFPPDTSFGEVIEDCAIDSAGFIHLVGVKGEYWGTPKDSIVEYVENNTGWTRYTYPEPDGFRIDAHPFISIAIKGDTSFMFYEPYSWTCMKMACRVGSLWSLDTVVTGSVFSPDAQTDESGNLWVFYHQDNPRQSARCAHQNSGSWTLEIVEDVPNSFWFTPGPQLAVKGGMVYALYKPTGTTKDGDDTLRFAWRKPDGSWYYEKMREFQIQRPGIGPTGLVHGLAAFVGDSVAYYVTRDPTSPKWDTMGVVDSVNGIMPAETSSQAVWWNGGFMLVDADGNLHAAYTGKNRQLCYATSGVLIEESSSDPGLSLILVPVPQGFWITGHSGEARIYDSAGRLVLSKRVKGKTLISPLKPGVYFVVAGREKARAAVR